MAPLFNPDPAAYLPHRYPFLMLDRIVAVETGVSASAEKLVTGLITPFPQILLIEMDAQLAGIAASHQDEGGGFIASIDRTIFSGRLAESGDTLLVSAAIIKSFGRLCLVEGTVTCNGIQLVEAQLTLGIGKV